MRIIECTQGDMDWHQARRGVPTASNFSRIITPKTGKPSSQMDDYIAELIADLTSLYYPERAESYTSKPMWWGIETEAEARRWYSLECNQDVRQVGFCLTDDGRFGCSPDGLVDPDGGLELKCPKEKTQVTYLLEGSLPDEYKWQVHGALFVTGRKWWDFASYAPGLAPLLVRVAPNEDTEKLKVALEVFWERYQAALAKVRAA